MSAPVGRPNTGQAITSTTVAPAPLAAQVHFDSELFDHPPVEEVVLATAGYDHTIRFWQAHTGQCVRTLQHSDSQVNALEISPDGQLLVACGYQRIRMFEVHGSNTNPVVNYEGVSKNVMDVGFQDQGKWVYTGGEDGTVKVWDCRKRNLQCSKAFTASGPVNTAKLHPNQQEIVIGDQNGVIHIWNLRSGPEAAFTVTPEPGASIQCISIDSKGNRMACVTNKGSCHVYDLKTHEGQLIAKPTAKFTAHKRYALKCKFSPDGSILATSSADQSTKIWRTSDWSLDCTLHAPNQQWVWDIAFSADSQYLIAATSDNTARLWSLLTQDVKCEYNGHTMNVTCIAFRDGASA